jgi:hypothetical protein
LLEWGDGFADLALAAWFGKRNRAAANAHAESLREIVTLIAERRHVRLRSPSTIVALPGRLAANGNRYS